MNLKYAEKSTIPMEVVLVTSDKDFETLPFCIESVRKYLMHPITKITLVAKHSERALKIADSLKIDFLDENELISLEEFKKYISSNNYTLPHVDSWYYQQFLKLFFYKKIQAQYYFVIDADIVLYKPLTLVNDQKIHYFYVGYNAGHDIYKLSIQNILGKEQFVPEFSFVADLMCFDKNIVEKLIQDTEKKSNKPFFQLALDIDADSKNGGARFSEFELYGVYANFNQDNNIISSFIPRDNAIHSRIKLQKDLKNPEFLFLRSIGYHSWVDG